MDAAYDISRLTNILLITTIGIGLLHHADHVLRVDHSGWPFLPQVTPFTFSLAAYPLLLFALLANRTPLWPRFAVVAG